MTSEARFLFNAAVYVLLLGGLIGVTIFAWMRGRSAERIGVTIYCVSVAGTLAFVWGTGQEIPMVPMLLLDTAVACGFLALAIRYNNLWLGAAMMVKGLQLALHASHLTEVDDPYFAGLNLYAIALDMVSLAILVTIFGATLASAKARRIQSPNVDKSQAA